MAFLSILIAIGAFVMAVISYLGRNRPYIGVQEIKYSGSQSKGQEIWSVWEIIVANVGEIPATSVKLDLSYSLSQPEPSSHELGAIFPHQHATIPLEVPLVIGTFTDDEGRVGSKYIFGDDSIPLTVYCRVIYAQPPIFGLNLRNFHTNQPVTITAERLSFPSKSERADIS